MPSNSGNRGSKRGATARESAAEAKRERAAQAKRAHDYKERRRRWRKLVAPLVAAAPGGSHSARCAAVGGEFGVSWKTVDGYVGGEDGKGDVSLPDADGLARICRKQKWDPLHVLYGGGHPERVHELAPRLDLAQALARYVETELADATDRGELSPLPPDLVDALARTLGLHAPPAWAVDGERLLTDVAERATKAAKAKRATLRESNEAAAQRARELDLLEEVRRESGGQPTPMQEKMRSVLLARISADVARIGSALRAADSGADYLSIRGFAAPSAAPDVRGALATIIGAPARR